MVFVLGTYLTYLADLHLHSLRFFVLGIIPVVLVNIKAEYFTSSIALYTSFMIYLSVFMQSELNSTFF